jgi:hypothetical protein
MKNLFSIFSVLVVLTLFSAACNGQVVRARRAEQAAPNADRYQAMLGQRVHAKDVVAFLAGHNCAPSGEFQLCQSSGLAFWTDADQIVQMVYLYVNNSVDFAPYKGELPFGLTANDTMANVEQKMGKPNIQHAPRPVWTPNLPGDGGAPKYTLYRASYERFGMTIVYNAESASDTSASIYAILVSQ